LPAALAAAKDGKLRVLGVATDQRAEALPDVPTFAEQGVKDQDSDTLTGLVVPAATPKEIVDLLQNEIAKIAAQQDVKEKLATLGFVPVANTPAQFAERIKQEIDKWGKIVRDAKLRIE
jgi:tripartite-type tricarboxylate transporter receptor subunit TctC